MAHGSRDPRRLHKYVTEKFEKKDTSFLFLGFGFRHWRVRILLHLLKARGHQERSLALETPLLHKETMVFFHSDKIEFHRVSHSDFVRDLRKAFESLPPVPHNHNHVLPPDTPVAFLCHRDPDKEFVEDIRKKLEYQGIRTWMDKQKLRGGDRWRQLIPDVIEKQVNYIIVFQSPHMFDEPENYVFAEIDQAKERQKMAGPEVNFIMPVIIEKNKKLPLVDLIEFHCIDLTESDGVDKLVQAIHEDWKRRPKRKEKIS